MATESPYLLAIQAIPGTVPGQKYKELNLIAQKIVACLKSEDSLATSKIGASTHFHGDTVAETKVNDVPEPLRPLVQLEIANILRHYDGVVEGLKSEDSVVVNRAMTMSWFFRGANKDIINVEYFKNNVLPFVSLDTRNQLIKRLAMNLRSSGETKVGEEFYTYFARQYGRKLAETLLIACSENFIYDVVTANKIILSCRIVRILFVTNPNLVIRYLKSFKPLEGKFDGTCADARLCEYSDFLPRLIKKHASAFIELLEMHNHDFGIKLSNKAAETFLKSNVEALLDKPNLYAKIMPLKVIAAKLTKPQYKSIFPKMFPKRWQDFRYKVVEDFLQYYPEQERITLVIESYKEAYNANFLDNTDAIDENFLCMLPKEERTRQARIKLEKEPDWRDHRYDVTMAWRCYLPISESIPSIKNEISKTSNADDRSLLLNQMFYTCKVNEDKEALLDALIYFTTRHKNEMIYVITDVLIDLAKRIDLSSLSKDHWKVLNDFIQFLRVKGEIKNLKEILIAGVHFNLIHDLPIDENIEMILEIYLRLNSWNPKWSILEKYPEYDRQCIDAFMNMIPLKYPETDEIWKDRQLEIVEHIVESIYEFNTRNTKANCKIDKLSIKNWPWLLKSVKKLVETPQKNGKWRLDNIISILKIHEKDLYKDWIVIDPQAVVPVVSGEALQRLNKDPKNILDNWEKYLEQSIQNAHSSCAQRFIRETRWHQLIPIKFLDKCLNDFGTGTGSSSAIQILGILMEGNEFAQIIEPLLPQDSKIDTNDENAKSTWDNLINIPKGMNLTNPPVPLRLILRLCQGDYLCLGLSSLTNACRRTSIEKIEPFIKALVDRQVSVKKHGIRIFCLVASIDELREFLSQLWKTEKHRSIRAVIFEKIYSLFITETNPDTWQIMKNCIADFTVDDDTNFEKLTKLKAISIEYISDYIKQLLDTVEKLEANGFNEKTANDIVSRVLERIDKSIANQLTEDFCQQLLLKYFCNPKVNPDVGTAGMHFVLNGYISHAGEKFEARLELLCNHYENVLKKHWNVPHPKVACFFPVNYFAHDFMTSLINLDAEDKIVKTRTMESVLKSFLTVLKPECEFVSYVLLTYGIALKDAQTPKEIVSKIGETLPKLVEALGPRIVIFLAEITKTWLQILVDSDKVEEVMYDLIENLCKIGTDHACLLAVKILFLCESRLFEERHSKIIETLRQVKCPEVVSLVYLHVNTRSLVK